MKTSRLISFDYAMKYLLKEKSGYNIVKRFFSVLLQAEGYPPVKIKALLDTESNREGISIKPVYSGSLGIEVVSASTGLDIKELSKLNS
jgi:hypothetical protein